MNQFTISIPLLLLFIYTLFGLFKNYKQTRKWDSVALMIMLHFVSILAIIGAEVGFYTDLVDYRPFLSILKAGTAMLFSLLFSLLLILVIRYGRESKIKTIWRIPFVGLFAGMYFDLEYLSLICGGYLLLSFFVWFKNKEDLRILGPKILCLVPAIIGMVFIRIDTMWILNIILLWTSFFMAPIHSIVRVNGLISAHDEAEEEN